jgi:hypothetical protein
MIDAQSSALPRRSLWRRRVAANTGLPPGGAKLCPSSPPSAVALLRRTGVAILRRTDRALTFHPHSVSRLELIHSLKLQLTQRVLTSVLSVPSLHSQLPIGGPGASWFYQTNPSQKFITNFQSIRTANHVSVFLTKTNPNPPLPTEIQPDSAPHRLSDEDLLVAPAPAGQAKNQSDLAKIKPNLTLFKPKNEINLDPFNSI